MLGSNRWFLLVILATIAMLSACSPSGPEDGSGGDAQALPSIDPEDSTSTTQQPIEPTTGDQEQRALATLPPVPTSDDPCTIPVEHEVGEHEYAFGFAGEERPVGIKLRGSVALEELTVLVGLHGAGRTWQDIPLVIDVMGLQTIIGQIDQQILFAAQAEPGESAYWTQSETFNREYLSELFSLVEKSVCLDRATVVLFGASQGALAAVQGLCEADLQVDLVVLLQGLVKMQECNPTVPVPILSVDRYEFDPAWGIHWDGSWNPPSQLEVALTGGIDATPDDLAVWAELFNCTDTPSEEELEGSLVRPTVILSYKECEAQLVAFGMEGSDEGYGINHNAMLQARLRMRDAINALLGED